MFEFSDERIAEFLSAVEMTGQSDEQELAYQALLEAELLAALDAHEAVHLWDPDDEQVIRNLEATYRVYVRAYGNGPNIAQQLSRDVISETVMASVITKAMLSRDGQLPLAEEELIKKELQATLKIRGYDEAWGAAVDGLFRGRGLDTKQPADCDLFVKMQQASVAPVRPVVSNVRSIVFDEKYRYDPETRLALITDCLRLIKLIEPGEFAAPKIRDAEELIFEMGRERHLAYTQVQRLVGLVRAAS